MKTVTLTRKIQVYVDTADAAEKDAAWTTLRNWQYACYRAANYIYTHQFLQGQVQNLLYLTEGTRAKLASISQDADGILCSSRTNTTYGVLSGHLKGKIPMSILNQLNHSLVTTFNREKDSYLKGEKSLRNYKRTIPIPFAPRDLRQFRPAGDGRNFCFRFFGLPLRTYLGRDFSDKQVLLQALSEGRADLRTSSLSIDGKKIYWLACFAQPQQEHPLDEAVLVEVALSLDFPLTVTIGRLQLTIGTKDEFLYRRLAIQAARQRAQRQAVAGRGGKGRKRKLKSVESYREKERRYVSYRLHVYSRRLIDLCIRHGAGTILLTGQAEKEEEAGGEPFVLRNWSYGGLKEKIAYKAAKAGIQLIVE